jgi:hypothetical protein
MDEELDGAQARLFSKAELTVTHELPPEPETNLGEKPVWTDKKARSISLYLRFFVYISPIMERT